MEETTVIARLACLVPLMALASQHAACAQAYPTKPLRIVTAAAGGGSDFATRLIVPALSASLGEQVVVDNRGVLAADIAAKAAPDGYTMLVVGATLWLLPFMRDQVPSDVGDFTPITMATQTANILVVHPGLPVKSVKDLVAMARARPGELNLATSGNGSSVHIAGELFKAMTASNMVRVNYKAASQALTDLIAGQVHLMFSVPGSALPHVRAGKIRALAVTSSTPTPLAPGLPTVAEAVPGYESVSYLAIFAPVGTPAPIVARLSQEIVRVLHNPDMKSKFLAAGMEALGTTPEVLAATVKADSARMGKVIKAAGIRAN
jgi:tripartite-type tricarboxylate transporter receptor subunit TctC